jgi:RNA polymerase sigma factor (sigma-70 family)
MRTERTDYDVAGATCRTDSDDRLEAYFRRYADWLGRTVRKRFGRSGVDADDVVQEAFLRLRRYTASERDERPRALLVAIASNVARDALRRARRGAANPDPLRIGDSLEADQYEQLLLKNVILGLPQPFRDVLLLARFTPMTHEQIAAHLGLSVKTIEWRMSRALALCAEALDR